MNKNTGAFPNGFFLEPSSKIGGLAEVVHTNPYKQHQFPVQCRNLTGGSRRSSRKRRSKRRKKSKRRTKSKRRASSRKCSCRKSCKCRKKGKCPCRKSCKCRK